MVETFKIIVLMFLSRLAEVLARIFGKFVGK